LTGIKVKQKRDLTEILTGCEMENKYKIFREKGDSGYYEDDEFFMAREESECCQRQCCGSRRSFKIHFEHDDRSDDPSIKGRDFLLANRPFTWACCCLCRPVMTV